MGTKVFTERHIRWLKLRSSPTGNWSSAGDLAIPATQSVTSGPGISDWRRKISSGIQATTPLDAVGTRITLQNGDHALTHMELGLGGSTTYSEMYGNFTYVDTAVPDPSSFIIQSVQNQVKMDMIAQIRNAHTAIQGLVTLGEMGETIRMTNGAGRGLFQGVRNYLSDVSYLTRGRRLTPQNLIRTIGEKWLEYSFGWRPLINDINDGMKAFDRWQYQRLPYIKVRAGRSSSEKTPVNSILRNFAWYEIRLQPILAKTYGYKIYGQVGITNSGPGSLAHNFGIRLDEFVPTVYELIPFSFLVDYFVNIGAVIDALSLNKSSIRWLNHGELRSCQLDVEHSHIHKPPALPWIKKEASISFGTPYRVLRYVKSRNGLPSYNYLIPSVEFSIPGSSTRWMNIAALVLQHNSASRSVRSYRI
jgi:hypothetical protein